MARYFLYQGLWKLLKPLVKGYFKRRGKKDSRYGQGLEQRFSGVYSHIDEQFFALCQKNGSLHIHAASLGEVNLIASFIKKFIHLQEKNLVKDKYKDLQVIITTNTPTGFQAAQKLVSEKVQVVYTPLEYKQAIDSFIAQFKPQQSLFVETELWPLFIAQLKKYHNSLALLNARLSFKYYDKYKKGMLKQSILSFNKIIAQNYTNALIYSSLVNDNKLLSQPSELLFSQDQKLKCQNYLVSPAIAQEFKQEQTCYYQLEGKHIVYLGNNLKFNSQDFTSSGQLVNLLYKAYREQTKVNLLLASTYPDEVEILTQALTTNQQNFNLVVAPRHPENFEPIITLLKDKGYVVTRFSSLRQEFIALVAQIQPQLKLEDYSFQGLNALNQASLASIWDNFTELLGFNHPKNVLVIDTIGDLSSLYQFMDLTLVGGTFNKVGGHDLIAPISHLNSVIIGPNYQNQLGVVESLQALDCINIIEQTSKELYASTLALYLTTYSQEYKSLSAQSFYCFIQANTDLSKLSLAPSYRLKEYKAYQYFLSQQNALINHFKILEII